MINHNISQNIFSSSSTYEYTIAAKMHNAALEMILLIIEKDEYED